MKIKQLNWTKDTNNDYYTKLEGYLYKIKPFESLDNKLFYRLFFNNMLLDDYKL